MMLIYGAILKLIEMDKMDLFPRELDFDSRCTKLISKPDKITEKVIHTTTLSIDPRLVLRLKPESGEEMRDMGKHTRNMLAIPTTFVRYLRSIRWIVPP